MGNILVMGGWFWNGGRGGGGLIFLYGLWKVKHELRVQIHELED